MACTSLSVGREKVLDNVHKIGLTSVRKSCSMALGDTGITCDLKSHSGLVGVAGRVSVRVFQCDSGS